MDYLLNDVMAERANKTVYYENGKTIKLFNEGYSVAQILNEALNQARVVEDTDLRIPKLFEVTKINNRWAIVLDHIYGKNLEGLLYENEENFEKYMELFVNIQREIHKRRVPLLGRIKEKFRRKITETTLLDNGTKYELLQRLEGMKDEFCLCHGDFQPSNVIIDDENNWHILDWAHATQGNPAADCARTYLTFAMQDKKDVADKYLDTFCRISRNR